MPLWWVLFLIWAGLLIAICVCIVMSNFLQKAIDSFRKLWQSSCR